MKSFLLTYLFVGIIITGEVFAQQQSTHEHESPSAVLEKIIKCRELTDYTGTFVVNFEGTKEAIHLTNHVMHRHPDFTQLVCLSPPQWAGRVHYMQGADVYHKRGTSDTLSHRWGGFYPEGFSIEKENINLILKNYDVKIERDSLYLGFPSSIMTIKARTPDRPNIVLVVEKKHGLVLSFEKYHEAGNRLFSFYYTTIDFSTPQPADSVHFSLNGFIIKEEKHEVFSSIMDLERSFGHRIMNAEYLPSGFQLQRLRLKERKGQKVAHLVYTDGLSSMSLFIRPLLKKEMFSKQKDKPKVESRAWRNIVRGRQGDFSVSCIGEQTSDVLLKVFRSIALNAGSE